MSTRQTVKTFPVNRTARAAVSSNLSMETLLGDLQYALRAMRRNVSDTAIAIAVTLKLRRNARSAY